MAQVYLEKHSQPTLWGHATRDPLQGLARGLAPFDPQRKRHASHHSEPHLDRSGPRERGRAKPSGEPRRQQQAWGCRSCCGGRWRGHAPGPQPPPKVERERTRELARIGSNLNQIARWANIHKENAEALEVAAHLVAIERALDTLTVEGEPR